MYSAFIALALAVSQAQLQLRPDSFGYPYFSPDGKQLLINSHDQRVKGEFIVSMDGSGLKRVEFPSDKLGTATWTADSKGIVFTHGTEQATTVAIFDLDTKQVRDIYAGVNCQDVALFSDGKRLLVAEGKFPAINVNVINLETKQKTQISLGIFSYGCSLSADEKQVVFGSKISPGPVHLAIYAANVDGTNFHGLSDGAKSAERPVWSPDGEWVAYMASERVNGKSDANVYIVSKDWKTTKQLTHHEGQMLDETPSWSPDGKTIAFQSNRSGKMQIYFMDADGSNVRPLFSTGN